VREACAALTERELREEQLAFSLLWGAARWAIRDAEGSADAGAPA
jgi:hypothetical protein